MQIVIKIPEEAKQAFDCAESNDLKDCYYDNGGVIGNAIKKGTPLPKGHGDIVDIETLIDMFWDGNSMEITKDDLSVIEPIIEADRRNDND